MKVKTMSSTIPGRARRHATLRPHTLMLDLLLGTVLLFALNLGPPTDPEAADTRNVSAPGQAEESPPLLLRAVRGPDGAAYRVDGQVMVLSAPEVAALARARKARLALVADPRAPLGAFLEAEKPLRAIGLDVMLALVARTPGTNSRRAP